MKKILILSQFILIFCCCGDEQISGSTDDPSNLELDVLVYEDGSGIVVVSASANNATEYHFYMGEENLDPYISSEGYYEYTYNTSGSYKIEVRAYGLSGRYVKKQKTLVVPSKDPVSVGTGYVTPFSYEGMDLVWNDEFTGNVINRDNWSFEIGTGCPDLCGWGNNELQYYREENTSVQGGVLIIEAREEDFGGSAYTSSRLITRGKQAFKYGRIDVRAVLPEGQGIWPAIWMLGSNHPSVGWPASGEIDIMEMVGGSGRENTVSGNVYWEENGTRNEPSSYTLDEGTFADEFHVFSIIWDETEICWYVDDNKYRSFDITPAARSEFQKPFFFILNVAVGGNWPGSPDATTGFPTSMQVDYIRVFADK